MNAETLELLREKILMQCRAASSRGITIETILRGLQIAGYVVDQEQLERELRHLVSAGLIQPIAGASLTPALRRYGTTAAGDHELERRGLL